MLGHCVVFEPHLGLRKWSEINFQPFGYFLTEESTPPNPYMCDISSFGDVPYAQIAKVKINTAYLIVNSPLIGTYDNVK
jgi:hypothetical protein